MLQETHFLVHRTQPLQLPANKEGYTVLAMSRCPENVPSDTWRLSMLSQQPVQGWSQQPCVRQDLFEGVLQSRPCVALLCCGIQLRFWFWHLRWHQIVF